ncbi:MAG: hypothetical protein JO041_13695 [Acidobacteria bacterium]|nr:hypothetical protein [Acidobacteriota bacterium]
MSIMGVTFISAEGPALPAAIAIASLLRTVLEEWTPGLRGEFRNKLAAGGVAARPGTVF